MNSGLARARVPYIAITACSWGRGPRRHLLYFWGISHHSLHFASSRIHVQRGSVKSGDFFLNQVFKESRAVTRVCRTEFADCVTGSEITLQIFTSSSRVNLKTIKD